MAENPDKPLAVETHPFAPFLPEKAKILILGSFPPKQERWSMDFFYPNFNNDMWRIFGLAFFGDKNRFIAADGKHFDKTRITAFCEEKGIALYDTAYRAARLIDNASVKFLETVEPAQFAELIESPPLCRTMAATGQKAAETVSGMFRCLVPATGRYETIDIGGRENPVRPVGSVRHGGRGRRISEAHRKTYACGYIPPPFRIMVTRNKIHGCHRQVTIPGIGGETQPDIGNNPMMAPEDRTDGNQGIRTVFDNAGYGIPGI